MECPKCTSHLVLSDEGYLCSSCEGIWLPLNDLKTLEDSYNFKLDDFISSLESSIVKSTAYSCPDCSHNLDESIKNDITLEYCRECSGIWFDKDELSQLITKQKSTPSTSSAIADGAIGILFLVIGSFLDS